MTQEFKGVTDRLEVELAILMRSFKNNPYGLGEFLNSALLRLVGPAMVQGESTHLLESLFFFRDWGSPQAVATTEIVCHRETCYEGSFERSRIFDL